MAEEGEDVQRAARRGRWQRRRGRLAQGGNAEPSSRRPLFSLPARCPLPAERS